METKERIEALIRYKEMNATAFANLCGYNRAQVIYDLLKGKTRNISASMRDRILKAIPEVNTAWLLTGEGEMLNSTVPATATSSPEVVTVPLVPLSAFAGPINTYYEEGCELCGCERIVSPTPLADLAIPISGDSMEPLFPNGSVVFIRRINEEAFIPWGHALVIDTENGVFIKNVMPDNGDDSYIWAESINPRYPKMHIPKKSIGGMYRVLNVQKSFITM